MFCEALKAVRRRIAEANGIDYAPAECRHTGRCAGTCPACEAEVRFIENRLRARGMAGLPVVLAGVAAGLCAAVPMDVSAQSVVPSEGKVRAMADTVAVADFASEDSSAVVVRGMVCDDEAPLAGAIVSLCCGDGSRDKGAVTDMNGLFAVRVPLSAVLSFRYVGYKTKDVKVKELLSHPVAILELNDAVLGEIPVVIDTRTR